MAGTLDMAMAAADAAAEKPFAVNAAQCIRVRNRNVPCNLCTKACPAEAIQIVKQSVEIDWERCVGCLACTLACPTQALSNHKPTDEQVVADALQAFLARSSQAENTEKPTAYVACELAWKNYIQRIDTKQVGTITCVSQIDEAFLLSLAAAGAQKVVALVGDCNSCARFSSCGGMQASTNLARSSEAQANELLAAYGMHVELCFTTKLPRTCALASERAYNAERRNMFGQIKEGMTRAVGAAMTQQLSQTPGSTQAPSIYELLRANSEGTLPVFVPPRRQILLKALAQLGTPEDEMWNVRLWGYPVVNESLCVGCSMCSTFCPSGALRIVQAPTEEGEFDDEERAHSDAKTNKTNDDTAKHESSVGDRNNCYLPDEPERFLVFCTSLCLKCKTCTVICITHAIDFEEAVFAQDVASCRVDILKTIEPAE